MMLYLGHVIFSFYYFFHVVQSGAKFQSRCLNLWWHFDINPDILSLVKCIISIDWVHHFNHKFSLISIIWLKVLCLVFFFFFFILPNIFSPPGLIRVPYISEWSFVSIIIFILQLLCRSYVDYIRLRLFFVVFFLHWLSKPDFGSNTQLRIDTCLFISFTVARMFR